MIVIAIRYTMCTKLNCKLFYKLYNNFNYNKNYNYMQ